jgi:hypothetical protein
MVTADAWLGPAGLWWTGEDRARIAARPRHGRMCPHVLRPVSNRNGRDPYVTTYVRVRSIPRQTSPPPVPRADTSRAARVTTRTPERAGTGKKKCMVPPAFHLPLSLSCTTAKHGNCSKALEATHGATQRSLHLRLAYSAMLGY